MKLHLSFLTIALWIICIEPVPASTVYASPLNDLMPNPAAESYLLSELRATGFADLEAFSEIENTIGGDFLVTALKDPEVQSKSFIYIANTTVVGDVIANDFLLPANIQFDRVEFTDYVDFNSSLMQSLWIGDSNFLGPVDLSLATFDGNIIITNNTFESLSFARVTINGNVDLRDNVFNGGINFYGAHVTGELLLDGSRVLGTEPLPGTSYPAEFWTTTVDGLASFANTSFSGQAYFAQSNFYRLDMWGVTFDQSASFSGTTVDRSADFTNATFKQEADFSDFYAGNAAAFKGTTFNGLASFKNASVLREADFSDAIFNGEAIFDFFTAERFIDFYNTTFNQSFSFYYTTVAWPYFDKVIFNGPVNFEGMHASEDFELIDTSYNFTEAPFHAYLMEVDGTVKFTGFTAPAGILLSQGHFGSLSINTKDNPEIASIDLTATDIDGQLVIDNVNLKSFLAEGATIGKSTTLNHLSITEQLDMRNASIGFLKLDDQLRWPDNPSAFNLRGMTYTDIDLGDQGLTEETWQGLLQLVNQSAYSPQAYQALAQFLTDKGHPDWAADVELAQKRRERNEVLTPLSGPWLWSWFLDIFAGYGYRPAFAFIWSGLVVAIGAFVFRRKEDMLPVEQDDAKLEYNPIWYSFALFIPYINLGIAEKWEPNPTRKWARNYKYVHMMLGWILAPIALLTFSGIIG